MRLPVQDAAQAAFYLPAYDMRQVTPELCTETSVDIRPRLVQTGNWAACKQNVNMALPTAAGGPGHPGGQAAAGGSAREAAAPPPLRLRNPLSRAWSGGSVPAAATNTVSTAADPAAVRALPLHGPEEAAKVGVAADAAASSAGASGDAAQVVAGRTETPGQPAQQAGEDVLGATQVSRHDNNQCGSRGRRARHRLVRTHALRAHGRLSCAGSQHC